MILREKSRVTIKLLVMFALVWSFLMPTAELVVTPVSKTIPAVSASTTIHSPLSSPAHMLTKLRIFLPAIVITLFVGCIVCYENRIRNRLDRFAPPIPLLRKQLLLRPLKFTSHYVI